MRRNSWTSKRRQEIRARRASRLSDYGRQFETEVSLILEDLKAADKIKDYERHPPHSSMDYDGKDFSVVFKQEVVVSFGVTISFRSWHESKLKHPTTPQFCFPIGTKKETIIARVLGLNPSSETVP